MRLLPAVTSRDGIWRVRAERLIRGRWAVGAALGLLGVSAALRDAPQAASTLLQAALGFGLTNLLHAALVHRLPPRRERRAEVPVGLQLVLDLLLLTMLVHRTGGLQSPFLVLFLVPAMVATLLLRTVLAPVIVALSLLSPLLLRLGVSAGVLQPWAAPAVLPFADFYPWLTLSLGVGISCVIGLHVAQRLREQDRSLVRAEQLLRRRGSVAEEARESARALEERVSGLAREALVADFSTDLARRLREPLGIVRARAEALRLSLTGENGQADLRKDVDVLLRNLESVQRGLRGILAFLPAPAVQDQVPLGELARRELGRVGLGKGRVQVSARGALPRLEGSHDEIELATGLLLRVAAENAAAEVPIRVRWREQPAAGRHAFAVRFAVRNGAAGSAPPADPALTQLRLAVLRQVVEKHGGDLRSHVPAEGRARIDVNWPRTDPTHRKAR